MGARIAQIRALGAPPFKGLADPGDVTTRRWHKRTATGVSHAAVGITAHAMQSMAIKGFIVHDRESGAYALTDSGRAALLAILGDAGLT